MRLRPLMVGALLLISAAVGLVAGQSPLRNLELHTATGKAGEAAGPLCSPCLRVLGGSLGLLQNRTRELAVDSCEKLCSHLPHFAQEACNDICDVAGRSAFMQVLREADLDPFFLCERLRVCPIARDDAAARLVSVTAQPAAIQKGGMVQLSLTVEVANTTGIGEFTVAVYGPVTNPVAQMFVLSEGLPQGLATLSVELHLQDDHSTEMPLVWHPGNYSVDFRICQGECDSKRPHSRELGRYGGSFAIKQPLTANPTHYGNPQNGCMESEVVLRVGGVPGHICSPACTAESDCPSDVPNGVSASPTCTLRGPWGEMFCALICSSSNDCGTGSCYSVAGEGICSYPNSENVQAVDVVADPVPVMV